MLFATFLPVSFGQVPIFVDPAEGENANLFERLYAGWPLRFYGIRDGRLAFLSADNPYAAVLWPTAVEWLEQQLLERGVEVPRRR